MNSIKYVGLDVHRDTISVAVLNAEGKLVMQLVIATHATAILDFLHGLRGTLHVTFEEGTHSGWLYDLLVRRVAESGGVQSAQECAAEGGQQERCDRCAQAGRVVAGGDVVCRCITGRTARRR